MEGKAWDRLAIQVHCPTPRRQNLTSSPRLASGSDLGLLQAWMPAIGREETIGLPPDCGHPVSQVTTSHVDR
jgi:hypothetical protein